jgi:methylated-DNA-[protein]-cysteine S-methyltransferase
MSTLSATHMTSPVGTLTIVATDDAIVAIRWDTESDDRGPDAHNPVDRKLARHGDVTTVKPEEHAVLGAAVVQLREYFHGHRTDFDLPLDPDGTEFQRQAWNELQRIPFGETITYGEQAGRLGDRNKMRAVGSANGKNPIPIVVPCHRVVGADGKLTGFAGGLDTKAWLLDHEFQVRAAVG